MGKGWKSCVLPAATLAVSMTAKYTRQVRSAVLAELEQEYVAGARARGLSENRIRGKLHTHLTERGFEV